MHQSSCSAPVGVKNQEIVGEPHAGGYRTSFPVLRNRDVYPGSEFFLPGSRFKKIPDPHQRI
jgi:hypothetical protein